MKCQSVASRQVDLSMDCLLSQSHSKHPSRSAYQSKEKAHGGGYGSATDMQKADHSNLLAVPMLGL